MHPQIPSLLPNRPLRGHLPSRDQRRARLLDKASQLRRQARNDSDLWLAEQYEIAAELV